MIERAIALTNNVKVSISTQSHKIINFFLKFKTSSLIYHLVHIFSAVVNFFFFGCFLFSFNFFLFCFWSCLRTKRRGKTKELWLLMLLWNSRPIFMLVSCLKFLHFHFMNRWIGWSDTTNTKKIFFPLGLSISDVFNLWLLFPSLLKLGCNKRLFIRLCCWLCHLVCANSLSVYLVDILPIQCSTTFSFWSSRMHFLMRILTKDGVTKLYFCSNIDIPSDTFLSKRMSNSDVLPHLYVHVDALLTCFLEKLLNLLKESTEGIKTISTRWILLSFLHFLANKLQNTINVTSIMYHKKFNESICRKIKI